MPLGNPDRRMRYAQDSQDNLPSIEDGEERSRQLSISSDISEDSGVELGDKSRSYEITVGPKHLKDPFQGADDFRDNLLEALQEWVRGATSEEDAHTFIGDADGKTGLTQARINYSQLCKTKGEELQRLLKQNEEKIRGLFASYGLDSRTPIPSYIMEEDQIQGYRNRALLALDEYFEDRQVEVHPQTSLYRVMDVQTVQYEDTATMVFIGSQGNHVVLGDITMIDRITFNPDNNVLQHETIDVRWNPKPNPWINPWGGPHLEELKVAEKKRGLIADIVQNKRLSLSAQRVLKPFVKGPQPQVKPEALPIDPRPMMGPTSQRDSPITQEQTDALKRLRNVFQEKFNGSNSIGIKEMEHLLRNLSLTPYGVIKGMIAIAQARCSWWRNWLSKISCKLFGMQGRAQGVDQFYNYLVHQNPKGLTLKDIHQRLVELDDTLHRAPLRELNKEEAYLAIDNLPCAGAIVSSKQNVALRNIFQEKCHGSNSTGIQQMERLLVDDSLNEYGMVKKMIEIAKAKRSPRRSWLSNMSCSLFGMQGRTRGVNQFYDYLANRDPNTLKLRDISDQLGRLDDMLQRPS